MPNHRLLLPLLLLAAVPWGTGPAQAPAARTISIVTDATLGRAALHGVKALETARFKMGEIASSKRNGETQKATAELKRKIAQSERSIADYDKRTRRPLTTDLQSLSNGSWSHWDSYTGRQRKAGPRSPGRG